MPKTAALEFLGQFLSAGAAFFGLLYLSPRLSVLAVTLRGVAISSPPPEAAVGLAGLALAGLGAFAGIILGRSGRADGDIGVSLLFWVNFVVLLIGDSLFYAVQPPAAATVMLVGLASAVLTGLGLMLLRPSGPAPPK